MTSLPPPPDDLPGHWTARVPVAEDVPALTELVAGHQRWARGFSGVDPESVTASVTGTGSWTRRQVLVESPEGRVSAWVSVHDRAAGRTMIDLTVAPDCDDADELAAALLGWAAEAGTEIATLRQLDETQLDASVYAGDDRQCRWLAAAGYEHVRTWLNLSRPVDPGESVPAPRPGVRVRRVAKHEDGLPVAADIQVVHQMLEESFADHFNSYRESFPEFLQRLREDPGHRWDHWWIAELETDDGPEPGGALVSSVLSADEGGVLGSYVDYIGVHRRARGRGVAKALLHTVIADAQERGRNRVDLEVDTDSPTGADGLYASLGWKTKDRTESWHACQAVSVGRPSA